MIRCEVCGKNCSSETLYYYSGLNTYCCSEACFTSFLKKQEEKEVRNECYAIVSRVFNSYPLSAKLLAEIKRMCENYDLSYRQLTCVIHYMYDIKKMPIYSPTLYYVPQNISEARQYYQELAQRKREAAALIEEAKKKESEPIKVIIPNYNKKVSRKTGLKVNFEDIE